MTLPRLSGALSVALLALALLLPAAAPAQDVLPDLDQAVPSDLTVKQVRTASGPRFHLGFASAAANVGAGPLRLHGIRRSTRVTTMTVDQFVNQTAGLPRVVRGVGRMSYVVHPDHRHWHLLGFERYEIRAAGGAGAALRRDRKTGFCLGDRYPMPNAKALYPGFNPMPSQPEKCGEGLPGLTGVFAGISVGYGDRYEAHIEGQYIDVTGLPAGRYDLVHTVNPDGRIVERDLANNASSVLFSLSWPRSADRPPRVAVLRRCPASATCSQ